MILADHFPPHPMCRYTSDELAEINTNGFRSCSCGNRLIHPSSLQTNKCLECQGKVSRQNYSTVPTRAEIQHEWNMESAAQA